MPTPYREVDYTILQDHGEGVVRYECDVHAQMQGGRQAADLWCAAYPQEGG